MFFDLETTGLPSKAGLKFGEYHEYTDIHKYDEARVVQLSYMVCDEHMNKVSASDSIINSGGLFRIRNSHIHGITEEMSMGVGEDFEVVMTGFASALRGVKMLIAHNADFDVNVLKAELVRQGMMHIVEEMSMKTVTCTMKTCKEVVNAQNAYRRQKYPTLKELYEFATEKHMQHAHDAKYDVQNMHEAVKSLFDRKLIDIRVV